MNPGLDRARRELEAATLLVEHRLAEPAVSRAYYAAFYAAEAALAELGVTRSKHSGVISAFGEQLVRQHGFDPRTGRLLRLLFTRRGAADYSFDPIRTESAGFAVADATRFVAAVEDWVAARPR